MASVLDDLARWGPDSQPAAVSLDAAKRYTWDLAATHYENFPVLSWAVPPRLRQHFANVYAFCRWADDLGDETGSPEQSLELLDWWRHELQRCLQGSSTHPVYIALSDTLSEFAIPDELFSDLISAFEQDQTVREYETFAQLQDYCRRSANPVGRIVLFLAERASPENFALSDSICTGLQLANFWQDVRRDFAIGRVYLPLADRQRFGYGDEQLRSQQTDDAFRDLLRFEVERTREFLVAGRPLVRSMPGRLKVDIDLFIRGGLLVLRGIEKIDYDVWQQRPVVTKWQLAQAVWLSLLQMVLPGRRRLRSE